MGTWRCLPLFGGRKNRTHPPTRVRNLLIFPDIPQSLNLISLLDLSMTCTGFALQKCFIEFVFRWNSSPQACHLEGLSHPLFTCKHTKNWFPMITTYSYHYFDIFNLNRLHPWNPMSFWYFNHFFSHRNLSWSFSNFFYCQDIVILSPEKPSHETWSRLRHFPGVYFIQGTQKNRKDLVRPIIVHCKHECCTFFLWHV